MGLSAISAFAVVLSLTKLEPFRFIRHQVFLVSFSRECPTGYRVTGLQGKEGYTLLRAGETGGGPTAGVIRHGTDLVETNDGGSVKRSARPGTKAIWFT